MWRQYSWWTENTKELGTHFFYLFFFTSPPGNNQRLPLERPIVYTHEKPASLTDHSNGGPEASTGLVRLQDARCGGWTDAEAFGRLTSATKHAPTPVETWTAARQRQMPHCVCLFSVCWRWLGILSQPTRTRWYRIESRTRVKPWN